MGDHDTPSTCLSSRPHPSDIRDNFLHYRGCLGEKEGGLFLARLDERSRQRIRTEERRILELRAIFDGEIEETKCLAPKFTARLKYWRSCSSDRFHYWLQNSENRERYWEHLEQAQKLSSFLAIRLEYWRQFSRVKNPYWLQKLAAREKRWEQVYQRSLRRNPQPQQRNATPMVDNGAPSASSRNTHPTKDGKDFSDMEDSLMKPPRWGFTRGQINPDPLVTLSSDDENTSSYEKPRKENGFGMFANMILFKNSDRFTDPNYNDEEFPNQKVPIKDLLYNQDRKSNPLMREYKDGENEIRYFHLPGNNMEWVEEAIARHYIEDRPPYDGLFRRPAEPSKTYMLLRPQNWRGQLHGGRHDAVHTRHMRPRCDMVSSDPKNLQEIPNNLVLFMPYLHWETDRRRAKFDDFMHDVTDKHRRKQALAEASILGGILPPDVSDTFQTRTGEVQLPANGDIVQPKKFPRTGPPAVFNNTNVTRQHADSVGGATKTDINGFSAASSTDLGPIRGSLTPKINSNQRQTQSNGHAKAPTARKASVISQEHISSSVPPLTANVDAAPLGSIPTKEDMIGDLVMPLKLRTATEALGAKIKDEIFNHPRSKFSRTKLAGELKGLTAKMLVPHTALGQVLYHAALLSEAMDCYHEEKLLEHYLHANPPFHPRRTLDQSYYWTLKSTKKRDRDQVVYRGTAPKKGIICECENQGCKHIRDNSRRVARVVMVDQLWLWILDGNTLITSFPKRYGRNKPDPSAVHKSIRLRLKDARKNEIRSVYDLALIVLDECAKVFFDRTKTPDRKPQTMDLFAVAIGDVTNKQTIAYDHFWHTSKEASKIYKSPDAMDDIEDKTKSLLDINPEGKLLQEIIDIQDELDIMINIKEKQVSVFRDFNKCVEYMIAQPLAVSKELGTAKPIAKEVAGEAKTTVNSHGVVNSTRRDVLNSDTQWTLSFGKDLAARLDDRVAALHNLKTRSERTERALNGLLALKQQQAGVVQAREAVRQAEQSLRQGRAIMLFTVITIIFLPLSFAASIFGMNNKEIGSNEMPIRHQIKFMFTISLGVVLISFILAFSSFTRAGIAFVCELGWVIFTTRSGLYAWWHDSFQNGSKDIQMKRKKKLRELREEARALRQKKDEEKHKLLEEEDRLADEEACKLGLENV